MLRQVFNGAGTIFKFGANVQSRSLSTSGQMLVEKCINRIQLLGRVGRTPAQFGMEPRTTVAFSLATNRAVKVTKEDGTDELELRPCWHTINVHKPQLQEYVLKYIEKGSRLLLNGRIEYRNLTKGENAPRTVTVIVVDDMVIISSPRYGQVEESQETLAEGEVVAEEAPIPK